MNYNYDKDEIKNNLSITQVCDYISELGGEPSIHGDVIWCKTICHCGESHKLYYYDNTKLFRCYTECSDTFDIFSLTQKVRSNSGDKCELHIAIDAVAKYFGFMPKDNNDNGFQKRLKDWEIFDRYERIQENQEKRTIELKYYDDTILKHLPRPLITPWIEEGMTTEVLNNAGICFDPVNEGIVIPHYDIDKNLIGIRERTLIEEKEKYGKYIPAILNNKMYNHPLSFALYNLWSSKNNIKNYKKAIVFEAEKSTLLYGSYFKLENDISVACCGSNLIRYQFELLKNLGVEEIVIAFDKQFKELGDKECNQWIKKLTEINRKYSNEVIISFMFDKNDYLGYKMSPIDNGPDVFMQMFKERIIL